MKLDLIRLKEEGETDVLRVLKLAFDINYGINYDIGTNPTGQYLKAVDTQRNQHIVIMEDYKFIIAYKDCVSVVARNEHEIDEILKKYEMTRTEAAIRKCDTLAKIVKQLEVGEYCDEYHKLTDSIAFMALKRMAEDK